MHHLHSSLLSLSFWFSLSSLLTLSSALVSPTLANVRVVEADLAFSHPDLVAAAKETKYRDLLLEAILLRFLENVIEQFNNSKNAQNFEFGQGFLNQIRNDKKIFKDPMFIGDFTANNIHGNINASAKNVSVAGLARSKCTFLEVLRSCDLNVFELDLRLETSVRIAGKYKLSGNFGIMPVYGSGGFHVGFDDLTLAVRVLLVLSDSDRLLIARPKSAIHYGDVDIFFEKLMGSFLDNIANEIVLALADFVIDHVLVQGQEMAQKQLIEIIDRMLGLDVEIEL